MSLRLLATFCFNGAVDFREVLSDLGLSSWMSGESKGNGFLSNILAREREKEMKHQIK